MQGNVALTPHLRRTGNVLTIGSVVAILIATLLPASGKSMDAHFCVICGALGGVDSILNVVLFIPLGAGLAMSGASWRRAVLTGCLLSIAVETTQLLFIPGRDATLGDVITNTLGASLGFALVRTARSWLRPAPSQAAKLGLGWCVIWLIIQLTASFGFAPSIPSSRFYGEIAPVLGSFEVFRGRVLHANIDSLRIVDSLFSDGDSVAPRLRHAGHVVATVVPAEPPAGIAPILRVADTSQREIVLLAQDELEFLFGVRTGAATLRLRPPLFGLPGAFPPHDAREDQSGPDTVMLTGRYHSRKVSMHAGAGRVEHRREIPLITSLGWTLILPAQWFIEGTLGERVLSWIWIALLVLPGGYWAAFAIRRSPPRNSARTRSSLVWAVSFVAVGLGLGLAPIAFGLSPTPVPDWVAALAGLLVGAALGGASSRLARSDAYDKPRH